MNELSIHKKETMEEFPILFNHITSASNSAESINRANIAIVNIRNILGWNNEKNTYAKFIVDVNQDENMREVAESSDNKEVLVSVLEYLAKIILVYMEPIFPLMTRDDTELIVKSVYASTKG
jgi:hypothetical protein